MHSDPTYNEPVHTTIFEKSYLKNLAEQSLSINLCDHLGLLSEMEYFRTAFNKEKQKKLVVLTKSAPLYCDD